MNFISGSKVTRSAANYCLIDKQLLSVTEAMIILGVNRAKFYEIVKQDECMQTVKPLSLMINGRKQYRYTELIAFIEKKQAA